MHPATYLVHRPLQDLQALGYRNKRWAIALWAEGFRRTPLPLPFQVMDTPQTSDLSGSSSTTVAMYTSVYTSATDLVNSPRRGTDAELTTRNERMVCIYCRWQTQRRYWIHTSAIPSNIVLMKLSKPWQCIRNATRHAQVCTMDEYE